jgi:hypothetical protein
MLDVQGGVQQNLQDDDGSPQTFAKLLFAFNPSVGFNSQLRELPIRTNLPNTIRWKSHAKMQLPWPFADIASGGGPVTISDSAPTWDVLKESASNTATGQRMADALELRRNGVGPAHTDATLRLFDAESEKDVRVTLYRDDAAWCPYCQKVWLLLEEKRIPFKVSKINMRSYGDKPAWFTNKVPGDCSL